MEFNVCKTDKEIEQAMMHTHDLSTSDEMDQVKKHFLGIYEKPIVVPLSNYMDAVYTLVEEECGDWSEYIDFLRYMKDLVQNEENLFSIVKTSAGYCIAYEDLPDYEEIDDEDPIEV